MKMIRQRSCGTGRKRKRNQIHLPEEIINQILVRLPTKSVARFNSVCKLWLSLISQSTFKNTHLKHVLSHCNHQKIMIVSYDFPEVFYLIDQDGKSVQRNFNFPFQAPNGIYVLGSCNGLLIGGIRGVLNFDHVTLWNPLFNDYKIIPFANTSVYDFYGFDYDLETQDYKVIRIGLYKQEAEVYNLKSGLLKSIPFELDLNLSSYHDKPNDGRVFKGCIYWIAVVDDDDVDDEEVVLIEFNVRYEKFRIVNLPCRVASTCDVKLNAVKKDYLGIFIYNSKALNFNLVTMKKKENGGDVTWSKPKFRNPPEKVGWPLCMLSNDDILMRFGNKLPKPDKTPTNDLFIYNPRKKTITNTGIQVGGACMGDYISHMDTLVLPGSAE